MRWVHDHNDDSPEQTELLGKKLAARLKPGDVIAYYGDPARERPPSPAGWRQGLGVTECVTSPTYTIVNEYLSGRMPLFHFDMYRLSSSEELFDIGWEDYLARRCVRGGVGENVEDALEGAIAVTIEKDPVQPGPAQHYDRRRRTL